MLLEVDIRNVLCCLDGRIHVPIVFLHLDLCCSVRKLLSLNMLFLKLKFCLEGEALIW